MINFIEAKSKRGIKRIIIKDTEGRHKIAES
jgi:hypothetical protein